MHFSKKYFEDNKSIEGSPFKSEDEVSTLAYSILMLNTDLHNPNLTKHMTCEEFIKNNLSTKLYDSFPTEYFKNIYKCIASDPLKVANSRIADYTKSDEIFKVISSKSYYYNKMNVSNTGNDESHLSATTSSPSLPSPSSNQGNILDHIDDMENSKYFNLSNLPFLNVCENFCKGNTHLTSLNVKSIYVLLWEDLFYNFMAVPYKFYELKDDNTLKVLENLCMISQSLNQKENIDKLIVNKFF
jgi:Sec7-like guanine-nucleotide exchange factor